MSPKLSFSTKEVLVMIFPAILAGSKLTCCIRFSILARVKIRV
jgi:hypothetical protein